MDVLGAVRNLLTAKAVEATITDNKLFAQSEVGTFEVRTTISINSLSAASIESRLLNITNGKKEEFKLSADVDFTNTEHLTRSIFAVHELASDYARVLGSTEGSTLS